jgi:putative protease
VALRAAVGNGADAVYLGAGHFNARRSAGNFGPDELAEGIRYAHLRGVRVYLTVNILVLPDELVDALALVDEAWVAGVDAVIVQDIGLLSAIRQFLPDVRIHASTQVGVNDSVTAKTLAEMGVARVTLARETSVGQIRRMCDRAGVEIESFVHGALCFCYSGQCLMSSLIGGRSGNRGMCAQPCRMHYELFDAEGAVREVPGRYLLSPKDLAGIELLPELVASGVSALKIEGRMKSPEYVALVTGVYRKALDRAVTDPDSYAVTEAERDTLSEAFTRGFSAAYLDGIDDDRMMSYTRPNDRGVLIGRLGGVGAGRGTLSLERSIDAEDIVEVWTRRGRFTQAVGEMEHKGQTIRTAPAGEDVIVSLDEDASSGDRVFRVVNSALEAAARRTFDQDAQAPRVPVDFRVRAVVGELLEVEVATDGISASVTGPEVETARTKALTAEEVMEHVGRTGSTAFTARSWDIELQPGVGMGFSTLHRTRAEALRALEGRMLERWASRASQRPRLSPPAPVTKPEHTAPLVAVRVTDPDMADACFEAGADVIHIPLSLVAEQPSEGSRVVYEMPRIAHDGLFESSVDRLARGSAALATSTGSLSALAARGLDVEAHWALNATNPLAVDVLAGLGARRVWLSPELRIEQIAETIASAAVPCGVAVYGRQELMVTQHCVLGTGGCDRDCASCDRRLGWSSLKDEKGFEFPVMSDLRGLSHIVNSVPLDVTHAVGELLDAGVAALRIDLTVEDEAEARQAIVRVRSAVADAIAGGESGQREPATTTGHYFRGVQ